MRAQAETLSNGYLVMHAPMPGKPRECQHNSSRALIMCVYSALRQVSTVDSLEVDDRGPRQTAHGLLEDKLISHVPGETALENPRVVPYLYGL